ncbi:MAG: hypothetical protein IPK99_02630 [Flavobacteriales bacterium]|nr:hypothetical protein [Flavobacteriales bacterium]
MLRVCNIIHAFLPGLETKALHVAPDIAHQRADRALRTLIHHKRIGQGSCTPEVLADLQRYAPDQEVTWALDKERLSAEPNTTCNSQEQSGGSGAKRFHD